MRTTRRSVVEKWNTDGADAPWVWLCMAQIPILGFEPATLSPNREGGTVRVGEPGIGTGRPRRASHTARPITLSVRSEEHTSELQSRENLVCRLLLEKKKH